MSKKMLLSLCGGVLLSSLTLYFTFRNVPFSDLLGYFGAINYVWTIPTVLAIVAAFFLRAWRWKMILDVSSPVGFSKAYHPLVIGFMFNIILPLRIGEAARPFILTRNTSVPFTKGLATVAAERVFDAAFLFLFLSLVMSRIPMDSSLHVSYGQDQLGRETLEMLGNKLLWGFLILLATSFCIAFDRSRKILNLFVEKLPEQLLFFMSPSRRKWVHRSISVRITRMIDRAADGFLLFKHPLKLVACTGVTLVIWFLTALSYYTMALGCPDIGLSLYELSFQMVIICFFIALPSVPGYWGVWEAGGIFALSLFGVSRQAAAGYTLANHAVQMSSVFLLGIISILTLSINIRQLYRGLRSG